MKNNLKKYREKQCFTQDELAEKANISVRQIRNIESGKVKTSVYIAIKLAQILKTTVEELF